MPRPSTRSVRPPAAVSMRIRLGDRPAASRRQISSPGTPGRSRSSTTTSYRVWARWLSASLLIVIVPATLFATSEYRRGLIRTTFAASPRRGHVLAAGAIATAIAEVITRHVLAANGNYLFPQSGPDLARVVIGTGLLLGLAAALAVGLGMMLRLSAPAVAAGIVLLVLPGILGSQSGNWLMRFTPTAAFAIQATLPRSGLVTSSYTPPNGYFPTGPWAGLAVLAAYTAAALGAAAWLVRRRDAV